MSVIRARRHHLSLSALGPFLLLHLFYLAVQPRAAAATDHPDLPPLPGSVDIITCSPKGCEAVPRGVVPDLCTRRNTVLITDDGACFTAAVAHAGYKPTDLSKCSGGEIVFCKQLLNLLNTSSYTFAVVRAVEPLQACIEAGQAVGIEHVLFVHGIIWKQLTAGERFLGGYRVREPFHEDCLISLTLWPTDHPHNLWPGDLRYYVTSFPSVPTVSMPNNYILMSKPLQCPTSTTFRHLPLPPYGVLFEKYKVMPWKVNMTDPWSHNGTLWREIMQRVHLVVLDCTDALAAKLQWDPDYKDRVTCWKESPLSQEYSYHDLMMGAAFFLGLGATPQTPTPVDLIYCRTPIIMPSYQQPFISKHAGRREYFNAKSSESVLQAVDFILNKCNVTYESSSNGTVTKMNTCFEDPASLESEMGEQVLLSRFRKMMHSKEMMCHNLPPRASRSPSEAGSRKAAVAEVTDSSSTAARRARRRVARDLWFGAGFV